MSLAALITAQSFRTKMEGLVDKTAWPIGELVSRPARAAPPVVLPDPEDPSHKRFSLLE